MDPFFILITWLLFFLAGVGLGTFVLGSRIRKVVAEAIAEGKAVEAKVEQKIEQIKKVF